ncbi:MAG: T9SS type A sorting domain-containing protein [Saprospiraceae bacterium]|nr:T9SS type A sorting domain-containing protein [Saprospiraceae bacterium]
MNKSLLSCFLFALLSHFAFANPFSDGATGGPADPPPCLMPPPASAGYTQFGSNWLKLEWSTVVPPGISHRIKTYRLAGHLLVSNLVAPPGTDEIVINGLQPGTQYYSVINAICSDGTESLDVIISNAGSTVITDLVVMGLSNSNNPAVCTIDHTNNTCEFTTDGTSYYFKVLQKTNPGFFRQFIVRKENGKLRAKVTSVGGDYTFKIDGEDPTFAGVEGHNFQIYINNGSGLFQIASFNLSEVKLPNGNIIGHLTTTYLLSGPGTGYEIQRLTAIPANLPTPPTRAPGGLDERSEKTAPQLKLNVAPNPFDDQLTLHFEQAAQTPVWLRLLNLSGQVVLEERFEAGQAAYTVPTAHLSPGFYLLRLEAEDQVQTIKVVKHE